ncbi:M56 family metallopeptidase [uncultured Dokdonia sp.]|uniref:M56 family metallopeptidase n=1 Tax=unclassified Dokdonia TaxID=2615033 RepID=UPI002632C3B8|nr:M56 family metallopeptidase [uncultured Dokdonia sp.]
MIAYIIQVICFQAIFLAVYYLLLRKETFFVCNRIYLLMTPLIALLLPFIKIASLQTVVPVEVMSVMLPEVVIGEATTSQTEQTNSFIIPWLSIYFVGVAVSVLLLLIKVKSFISYLSFKRRGEHIINVPNSTEAFTFFKYIFIGEDIDTLSRKQILTHEQIHAKQGHTWDLIFFEIMKIIFWFNPLIYFNQKLISTVHEYLADQKATAATSKKAYYEKLLNTAFGTNNLSFTNTFFNQSLIKNRIIMLQKSKSKKSALIKYMFIAPLVLSMLVYVSCSEDNELVENQSLEQKISELQLLVEQKENLSKTESLMINDLSMTSAKKTKGTSVHTFNMNKDDGELIEVVKQEVVYNLDENGNIPFAVIDEVPVFPGCESVASNEQRRDCMSQKISALVNSNFNIGLGKQLNLTGTNRIFASFKIDKNGYVTNLRTRSPHPDLDVEAQRVISMLPKMKPGKHNGEEVGVLYSLPIIFKIAE